MLTIEDGIALRGLSAAETDVIAEHEDAPEIIAADGQRWIKRGIRDDIAAARARGDAWHSAKLKIVLQHFIALHRVDEIRRSSQRFCGCRAH